MRMMSREQVERLRERYPIGSQIELHEMPDDPRPIESGTRGKLIDIDDTGTLFVKWDNGRCLGVVPGHDVFSVLPPEQAERDSSGTPSRVPVPRHKAGHGGQER